MVHARPPFPSGLVLSDRTPFVGRLDERKMFEGTWDAVVGGHRQVVFVGGEPGAGKSRLVGEAATACYADGAIVLAGASTRDLGYTFQPFVEMLDHLFGHAEPGFVESLSAESVAHLARLSSRLPTPEPEESRPTWALDDPRLLFEAVVSVLRHLCGQHSLVLVFENLHWAGPHTRQLFTHLIQVTAGERLLVLATHRTTAPDRTSELTLSIADLYSLTGVSRVDLSGLDTADVAEYLARATRSPTSTVRQAAALLRDQTGGNPFFLEETWRDLQRHGGLSAIPDRVLRAPATVRDMLEVRLRAMSTSTLEVLENAAVAGDAVDTDLLIDLGFDAPHVWEAVDQAVEFGLLVESDAPGRLLFRHALTRQAVADRIPRGRQAEIHAEIARALERMPRRTADTLAALAHHYSEAAPLGYRDKAVEYLTLTAMSARRSLGHLEAAAAFERAARHAGQPHATELMFEAATSNGHGGHLKAARQLFRELGHSNDPLTIARAAVGHEDNNWEQNEDAAASVEMLTRALRVLPADDGWYLRCLASLARALLFTGAVDQARAVGDRALELARATGDRDLIAHALMIRIHHMAMPDELEAQLAGASELWELAQQSDHHMMTALSVGIGTATAYRLGLHDEFRRMYRLHEHVERTSGQPLVSYGTGCLELSLMVMRGDFEQAKLQANLVKDRTSQFDEDFANGLFGVQMFVVERAQGRIRRLPLEVVRAAVDQGRWKPGAIAMYTELGLADEARALLPDVVTFCEETNILSAQWCTVAVFAVEAAALLRDRHAADRLKAVLEPFAGTNLMHGHLMLPLGSADRCLALLDHILGHPSATERFERALDLDRRVGSVTHEAETLLSFAAHLASIGEPDRAAETRRQGQAIADRIGFRRRIPLDDSPPSPRPPAPQRVGLTPREIDVLRLLATGKSNREIGEVLFISTNTAANHVRSILMKTGSNNRTQAAVYAADEGLLGTPT